MIECDLAQIEVNQDSVMFSYSKTTQYAIAAASRLAEVYDHKIKLSSMDIAHDRGLPKPVVAKVLTVLSQAGIVTGSPGPGGGYTLAESPEKITLYRVAECFDRLEQPLTCPFGPGYCGTGNPCPLHHQLVNLQEQFSRFLKNNSLASFRKKGQGAKLLELIPPRRKSS